jgi:archaellum biogenesis protein FlaJ (TadC family)
VHVVLVEIMLSPRLKLKLIGFAVGILVCYTIFGVLQEKIFRGRFGDEVQADKKVGEVFKLPVMFGAMVSVFYTLFAKGFDCVGIVGND